MDQIACHHCHGCGCIPTFIDHLGDVDDYSQCPTCNGSGTLLLNMEV